MARPAVAEERLVDKFSKQLTGNHWSFVWNVGMKLFHHEMKGGDGIPEAICERRWRL